jgi:lipopolysaccharide/colanic/teichoic acid biosynthesis glycosyltransferase
MWDDRREARWPGLIEVVNSEIAESKKPDDPRVSSRFARFCRKYSLDELPQFLHVICGEMSLVGPRPVTILELNKYYGAAAAEVTSLRPGITGLWQVKGRNRLTYPQRRRLDLFLARHFSPALYLRILFLTVPAAFSGRDAW